MSKPFRSMALAVGAAALLSGQVAYAAPTTSRVALDPLFALSVLGTAQSRAAACAAGSAAVAAGSAAIATGSTSVAAGTAATAVAVAPARPGCVFPVTDDDDAVAAIWTFGDDLASLAPGAGPVAGGGIGLLPLLLGGALIAGIAAWLLTRDDKRKKPKSP